jgi:hypothetical protein
MQARKTSRHPWWWLFVLAGGITACNDLTEPLPAIGGSYSYTSTDELDPARQRQGTIIIVDRDRLTARFDGNFVYVSDEGRSVSGALIGGFMTRDRIWFRFLTEPFEFHEATYLSNTASGEIFLQGSTYFRSGAAFSLRRSSF